MADGLLAGKRAIVTGGGGGIGSAIVAGLHAAGVETAAIGRSASVREVVAALAPNGVRVVAIEADLSERVSCEDAFGVAVEQLGGLDILVTSHGHVRAQPSESVDATDWDLTLATNLSSVFQLSQLSFAEMEPKHSGKIIHIASMYAFFGGLRVAAYAASKGGVAQLTKSLALEWAESGVNVNAIAPGYVKTKLNRHIWDDPVRAQQVISRIPAGRWGDPADLLGAVTFLASGLSDYVHGIVLPVDGGYLAR
ncbi:MAG: dehydrogenase, short-chain alcohol dehydrogenase like protein [Acidimicrobiaceae bacterium]|nr:dehydrogenase, short-chain alcohol dehydrogenase like protein [Acidimicrobiaceae bacterium]